MILKHYQETFSHPYCIYIFFWCQDREVENGGSPPRILSLDDYFMVETEKMVLDPDTGRKVKTKVCIIFLFLCYFYFYLAYTKD